MKTSYIYSGLVILAIVNYTMRALPFLIFGGKKKMPESVEKLSSKLPAAIMTILVVYNLRGTVFSQAPYGIPELVAVLVSAVSYYWKENDILTLVLGTGSYMILLSVMG